MPSVYVCQTPAGAQKSDAAPFRRMGRLGRRLNDDVTSVPTVLLLIPLFTTLTKCEAFRYIRADLLSKVEETLNNRNIRYIEGKPLFELLFEQEAVAQLVAKYLTTAMEIRDFLIENHRQST